MDGGFCFTYFHRSCVVECMVGKKQLRISKLYFFILLYHIEDDIMWGTDNA